MFLSSIRTSEAYWNSYRLLEQQLIKLSHSICFDDEQIGVYSSEIADIINSACIKIESLAKDIYEEHIYPFQVDTNTIPHSIANNKGPLKKWNEEKWKRKDWKYDFHCLVEINKKFALSKKRVKLKIEKFNFLKHGCYILPFCNISLDNCLGGKWEYSNRGLLEFNSNKFIDINWCKSYQEIKHNYIQSIKKHGTIKNAIMVLAAFYLLAIYNTCLPSKYFDWDYKSDKYELDFGSELFSCEMCYYTLPPFIIDSDYIKMQEEQKKSEELSPHKEAFIQQNILNDIEGYVFFLVLSENAYSEVEKIVSPYLKSTSEEKFDIAPYERENGLSSLTIGTTLYLKLKSFIRPPYYPKNIRIAFNNGMENIYNLNSPQGHEYERSKYKNRTATILTELKIGDVVEAKFVFDDFVPKAEIKNITEHIIELSIKDNKTRTLSEPISNIIYIKKLQT